MSTALAVLLANIPTFGAVLYFGWRQLRRLDAIEVAVAGHETRIVRIEDRVAVPTVIHADLTPTPVEAHRV